MVNEMADIELVIFDLDGTLIDSSSDIVWAANRTLEAFGRPLMGFSEVKGHIGWGVKPLLEKLMPDETPERIGEAREKFLEFYGGHLVVDTTLYPGAVEALDLLKSRGKKMALVTNKPYALSERILEVMDIRGFFGMVLGGDSLPNKKPHPEPVEAAIRGLSASPCRSVIVGDSPVDCEAGRLAGALTIGACYGFRGEAELKEAGCDRLIYGLGELKGLIV